MVWRSWSTCGAHGVTNPVISQDWIVITTIEHILRHLWHRYSVSSNQVRPSVRPSQIGVRIITCKRKVGLMIGVVLVCMCIYISRSNFIWPFLTILTRNFFYFQFPKKIVLRMITCVENVELKLYMACKCVVWISRSNSIMKIFWQFLPELCPFCTSNLQNVWFPNDTCERNFKCVPCLFDTSYWSYCITIS